MLWENYKFLRKNILFACFKIQVFTFCIFQAWQKKRHKYLREEKERACQKDTIALERVQANLSNSWPAVRMNSHLTSSLPESHYKIRRRNEIIYKVAISFKIFMSSEPLKTWCPQQKNSTENFSIFLLSIMEIS